MGTAPSLGLHITEGWDMMKGLTLPEQVLDYLQEIPDMEFDREYSPYHALQITAVRYAMAQNSYHSPYCFGEEVSERNDGWNFGKHKRKPAWGGGCKYTVRRYIDNPYFSQLLVYRPCFGGRN